MNAARPAEPVAASGAAVGRRAGRPFDRTRDAEVLASTLELLAERGYDRLTLDDVAGRCGRAKTTLYRRWATKEDLVLAAIRAAGRPPEADRLPDHGSLRADLLAVIDSPWLGGSHRRVSTFASLASAARSSERLSEVVRSEITEPYVDIYRRILQRAVDRAELPTHIAAHVSVLAEVIPAMSTHRLTMSHEPVDRAFFISVLDDVVLSALAGGSSNSPRPHFR